MQPTSYPWKMMAWEPPSLTVRRISLLQATHPGGTHSVSAIDQICIDIEVLTSVLLCILSCPQPCRGGLGARPRLTDGGNPGLDGTRERQLGSLGRTLGRAQYIPRDAAFGRTKFEALMKRDRERYQDRARLGRISSVGVGQLGHLGPDALGRSRSFLRSNTCQVRAGRSSTVLRVAGCGLRRQDDKTLRPHDPSGHQH